MAERAALVQTLFRIIVAGPLTGLVFDIEEVGGRVYTYISTIALGMEAFRRARAGYRLYPQ